MAYALIAWVLIQVVTVVVPTFEAPHWVTQTITLLLILGFPLAVGLAWAFDVTPDGVHRTRRAVVSPENRPGELDAAQPESVASPMAAPVAPPRTTPRSVAQNSIAVLPFENMSPNPDHAYFAAGIHEEILNSLAKLKSLSVIARTSVLQYAGTQKPIAEIAEALGVQTIMEGSVRYAGTRVRVTTQLIDAGTGAHLWSEAYEREFDDIFAIQADIAVQVANALRAEFTKEEQRLVAAPATTSTAAYALYLQALSLQNDGSANADRTQSLLDRAIALDPKFSLALGAKAALLGTQLINTTAAVAHDQTDLGPGLRKYAAAALEIDPRDGNAHAALCAFAEFSWHWSEARPHALRALETPNWGILVALVNWTLSWSGDADLAIDWAKRIERLNPTDWSAPWNVGIVLNYAGRYDEAAAALRRSIAILPAIPINHSWLAITEVARGDAASARHELELTDELLGRERQILYLLDMGYAYGRLGDAERARRLFDEIGILGAAHDIGAGGRAIAHMAIGEHNEALKWLREAAGKAARHEIDAGMFSLMNLKQNFTGDPVLERPEFVEARAQLKGD